MAGTNGIAGVSRTEIGNGSFSLRGSYAELVASGLVESDWLPDADPRKHGTAKLTTYALGCRIEGNRQLGGACHVLVLTQATVLEWDRMENLLCGRPEGSVHTFERLRIRDRGYRELMRKMTDAWM